MRRAPEVQGPRVINLDAYRRDSRSGMPVVGTVAQEESPGWLLRSPAYRVVESLAPWAGIADGGSFAALLGDPIDAHLVLTRFPSHALARSFCGGPTLGQVALAITREPRQVKARVWVGGFGRPDEGISVAAVYVRFEGDRSDADARTGRHPALWAWVSARLVRDGDGAPWPEPDEISADHADVREPGTWWRLRWGPSRTPYVRPARSAPTAPPDGS